MKKNIRQLTSCCWVHIICLAYSGLSKEQIKSPQHSHLLKWLFIDSVQFSSVQFSHSVASDSLRLHKLQHSRAVYHKLPEFTQTHVHWVHDAIQPSHPLSSPYPPDLNFPSIRVFSDESILHIRRPKYWSFSFRINSASEHTGLIYLRMDLLDLLAVQGTLKSPLQHHSSKASILWHSAFFTVQLSHPYLTTGKTIALKRWTCFGKLMSLLFNMLSRLVIIFLPGLNVF